MECLKILRGKTGPALSKPPTAQIDVLTHVDPNRKLEKLTQSVHKGPPHQEIFPVPQVSIMTPPSTATPCRACNTEPSTKKIHVKVAEICIESTEQPSSTYASVARYQQTQINDTSSRTRSGASYAPSLPSRVNPRRNRANITKTGRSRPNLSEEQFLVWRRMVPRTHAAAYRPLLRQLGPFVQQALAFSKSDHNLMQEVITLLSQEGGLRRINEVTSTFDDVSAASWDQAFSEQILPFLELISHDQVLASAFLEGPLSKIYNFLYGPNGARGIPFLANVFTLLKEPRDIDLGDLSVAGTYEHAMKVLSKTVEWNENALVNESLHRLVESVCEVVDNDGGDTAFLTARKYLQRIRRRFGRANPSAGDKLCYEKAQVFSPHVQFFPDLPGKLSEQGPRHDNDSDNICDIKIMPTSQEIQSERDEFLPLRDPSTWHLRGLPGLLDWHFRLLREDTVGQLRDEVAAEFKRMQNPDANRPRFEPRRLRTLTYNNITFKHIRCDSRGGLKFVVQFDQPPPVRSLPSMNKRREWWQMAKRLDIDSLACLIDSNGSAIFCSVSSCITDQPPKGPILHSKAVDENLKLLARDQNSAFVTLEPVQRETSSLREILARFHGSPIFKRESLVEFPGVMLPSFQATLLALQDMAKSLDLPFSDILAPESNEIGGRQEVAPPSYAMQKDFSFSLSSVVDNKDLVLSVKSPDFDIQQLKDRSTLDDTQATALVEALTRSLALIQGPPGTGKSYTGVSIIRVLIENREAANLGPTVCVCYTNHALDQLLEELVMSGIQDIVRIGGFSKSKKLDQFNLRNIAETTPQTRTENKRIWETKAVLAHDINELNQCLEALGQSDDWEALKQFLEDRYPHHHDELFSGHAGNVRRNPELVIAAWLNGEVRRDVDVFVNTMPRSLEDLHSTSLYQMARSERYSLKEAWMSEIRNDAEALVQDAYATYLEDKREYEKIRMDRNLRCLQKAHVIGVTTTGLAKNLDLLRRLSSKVTVCEEAGEVLEAHSLTTLLPSVEHAIFIGDHKQLRPKVQNWELNSQNPRGEQYSLDVSLFERLIEPPIGSVRLPFSTLETQRRMDPSISRLIKETLYPDLKDSSAVQDYPMVGGMRKRLFWFHHQQPEANQDPTRLISASYSNEFEVEFVAALVSHLVKQNVYGEGEIAVLTPYLGQLMRFRKKLRSSYEIVLGERDVEELGQAGLDEMDDQDVQPENFIEQTTLLKALRLSTVDNFQGEEAKVVVISLVRSNKENQCGFLRTSNRINVLLSRAKHGMYIIGNADTSYKVDMWAHVIKMLDRDDNFGDRPTVCGEACPDKRYCQICAQQEIKDQVVDFIDESKYKDVDLDRTPVIVPACGHVHTIESMDSLMRMVSHYTMQPDGRITGLKSSSQPFCSGELKVCPVCRSSLRGVARYGRIVRRAILDSSTKTLLVWASKTYYPLSQRMIAEEARLLSSRETFVPASTPPHLRVQMMRIEGLRATCLDAVRSFPNYQIRYASILGLRNSINLFAHRICSDEEPFTRLFRTVLQRDEQVNTATAESSGTSIMQTRGHVLAISLLIRCDLAILMDYLAHRLREVPQPRLRVDLSAAREDCEELIDEAGAREQPMQAIEGHIFWVRYAALEIACSRNSQLADHLLEVADFHLHYAVATAEVYEDQTKGTLKEIDEARRLLDDGGKLEYELCAKERLTTTANIASESNPLGKWFTCMIGHPFTIEGKDLDVAGMTCPQCGGAVVVLYNDYNDFSSSASRTDGEDADVTA
ncbi:MAG: hypothetical protein Q9165_002824 [Trypethelium subeluteriae]